MNTFPITISEAKLLQKGMAILINICDGKLNKDLKQDEILYYLKRKDESYEVYRFLDSVKNDTDHIALSTYCSNLLVDSLMIMTNNVNEQLRLNHRPHVMKIHEADSLEIIELAKKIAKHIKEQ